MVLAKRKSPTRCVEKYKNRKSNCVAVLQIAEKGCEYFLIVMKYLSKQYKYIYFFITIMATPSEQVYFNLDLRSLILSYNRCKGCGCYGYKDNTINHIPHFFINFHDVFCLQQWKTLHSVCKMCLDHTQYYNDMIIFRNRNDIMWHANQESVEKAKKKWKDKKGPNRKVLL